MPRSYCSIISLPTCTASARLLSLLRQNPELIALIALVLGTAPRLGSTLARHPQVMDALVDPSFFGALPDETELGRRLDAALAQSRYDEDLLERIRTFGLEYMFLIGVRILSGTVTARQAGEAFARLADAVIRAVHRAVADNLASTYGHLRGEETAILAMGKLGGYEMTATSDLDLILVYDFDDTQPESDGARSLYGAQYFARLTQRLINALTAQTNYGALYQVDMRLRPSGRAGPLATRLDGFAAYQETEAWTWEHMALTRARLISGSPAFRQRVERVIHDILRGHAMPNWSRATSLKCVPRSPRKKARATVGTLNTRPAGSSISSSLRNIFNSFTRTSCRKFSILRPRACSKRPRHCAFSPWRTRKSCVRPCSFIMI